MTITTGFVINSWTDPQSGAVYLNAWAQIRQINYTPLTNCLVVIDVYVSQESYQSAMMPIKENVISTPVQYDSTPQSSWMTYFDTSTMDLVNSDIVIKSLTYAQNAMQIS